MLALERFDSNFDRLFSLPAEELSGSQQLLVDTRKAWPSGVVIPKGERTGFKRLIATLNNGYLIGTKYGVREEGGRVLLFSIDDSLTPIQISSHQSSENGNGHRPRRYTLDEIATTDPASLRPWQRLALVVGKSAMQAADKATAFRQAAIPPGTEDHVILDLNAGLAELQIRATAKRLVMEIVNGKIEPIPNDERLPFLSEKHKRAVDSVALLFLENLTHGTLSEIRSDLEEMLCTFYGSRVSPHEFVPLATDSVSRKRDFINLICAEIAAILVTEPSQDQYEKGIQAYGKFLAKGSEWITNQARKFFRYPQGK